MNICIFGSEIGLVKSGIFVGGSNVSAVRLGQAMHAQGNKVFVFSSAPRDRPSRKYSLDWGSIVNIHVPGRYMSLPYLLLFGFLSFMGLLRFCKQNRIHVINSHGGHLYICIIPGIVGKILRIPVVHTQYCELTAENNSMKQLLFRHVISIYSKLPQKFCGISANVCVSLIRSGIPNQRVELIMPIIPHQDHVLKSRTKHTLSHGLKESDFVLLFVGNLKKNKGIDILFDSFIDIAPDFPNLHLIITTEMKQPKFREKEIMLKKRLEQSGLSSRVVWLGFVNNMINLIRDVDVVVVPFLDLKGISDYPLVVLEAMSVGTCVIATDVGGTPEVLKGNAGILIPPGDVTALNKGLRNILTNAYPLGRSNRLYIERFDSRIIGRKYLTLFTNEVCKNN